MNSIRAKFDNLFGSTGSNQQQQSSEPQPSASDMLNDKETTKAPSNAGKSKKRHRHGAKRHGHGHKRAHRHAHARTHPGNHVDVVGNRDSVPVPAGRAGLKIL